MGRARGVEPPTHGLQGHRSAVELRPPHRVEASALAFGRGWTPDRTSPAYALPACSLHTVTPPFPGPYPGTEGQLGAPRLWPMSASTLIGQILRRQAERKARTLASCRC